MSSQTRPRFDRSANQAVLTADLSSPATPQNEVHEPENVFLASSKMP